MAMVASSRPQTPSPSRARLRSKVHTVLLLALFLILPCYVYIRQDSSLRSQLAPLKLPWGPPSNDEIANDPSHLPSDPSGEFDFPSDLDDASSVLASDLEAGSADSESNSNIFSDGEVPISVLNNYEDDDDDYDDMATFGIKSNWALTPESPRAIVIESSMIPNLLPLMLHFAAILGPSWGVILFILEENWIEPQSPAYQRFKASGHIEIRFLPAGTSLESSGDVSAFLTSSWIWEQVLEAHRILLFQTDSILCSKSEATVEDYFEYDFIGAPISPKYGHGYNGGLSIRNPRLFWDIIQEANFSTSGQRFEDQFFFNELKKRGAALPDEMIAKTFSVETIYYETPLGYHQPQRWQSTHLETIVDWCPEVKMLIGRRAQ